MCVVFFCCVTLLCGCLSNKNRWGRSKKIQAKGRQAETETRRSVQDHLQLAVYQQSSRVDEVKKILLYLGVVVLWVCVCAFVVPVVLCFSSSAFLCHCCVREHYLIFFSVCFCYSQKLNVLFLFFIEGLCASMVLQPPSHCTRSSIRLYKSSWVWSTYVQSPLFSRSISIVYVCWIPSLMPQTCIFQLLRSLCLCSCVRNWTR